MNIRNTSKHDLELLVKWGDPKFSVMAQEELKRRAGQVEAPPRTETRVAAVTGNAALAGPAFPSGRWS